MMSCNKGLKEKESRESDEDAQKDKDWVGGQGRHLRGAPLGRDLITVREPAMNVSAGECFFQTELGGTRGSIPGEVRDVIDSQNRASTISYLSFLHRKPYCPMSGFLNRSTSDLLDKTLFWGCPVHSKTFSSTSGLCPLDCSSTRPVVTTKLPFFSASLALCFIALILCRFF